MGQPRRQGYYRGSATRLEASTTDTSPVQYRCGLANQANRKSRVGVTTAGQASSFVRTKFLSGPGMYHAPEPKLVPIHSNMGPSSKTCTLMSNLTTRNSGPQKRPFHHGFLSGTWPASGWSRPSDASRLQTVANGGLARRYWLSAATRWCALTRSAAQAPGSQDCARPNWTEVESISSLGRQSHVSRPFTLWL